MHYHLPWEENVCVHMCEQMCDAGHGPGWKGADLHPHHHHLYLLSTGYRHWALILNLMLVIRASGSCHPQCKAEKLQCSAGAGLHQLTRACHLMSGWWLKITMVGVFISQELANVASWGFPLLSTPPFKELIGKHSPANHWISTFQMHRK